ncbi:hypothetical protein [Actinokineospora sp. HUAS TT18]|uniref:hypothetical protein n=1 Tax=Actinokineospora sp. HUAS TT18 TaxID=3447451 RepID=UPI003F51F4B9
MFDAGGGGGGGLSAHQIYVAMTQGPGTHSLESAFGVADTEARLEAERAKLVRQLADKIEAGWEGQAGEAAYGAAKPLADVSALGAVNLEKTHVLLEQQATGFNHASAQVLPVAENPPEANWWDDVTPWDTDTEDEQAKYKEQSAHNIQVYRQYDTQSMSNEQALPMDYSTLQDPGGSVSVTPPDGGGKEPIDPNKKDPWTPPGTGGDDRNKVNPPPPPYSEDRPPPYPPPGETRPQAVVPPQTTLPNEHHQLPNRDVPRPPYGPPQQPVNPLNPLYPQGPYGPGGRDGQGGGRGYGPGGPRGGAGYGPGGARGFGPGGGAGEHGAGARAGAAEHGPGGRAGAGALGGEHGPGGRGAAGAAGAGRGGAGMGGGMGGGGRGQGGEDSEHTRASFLQEDDPEAIFGTDEVTAPPVIGE